MNGYDEHLQSLPDSIADLDRADATQQGELKPTAAWVLSDRDVWYRNPYYTGPEQPHPEDDEDARFDAEQEARERGVEAQPMDFEEPGAYLGTVLDDDLPSNTPSAWTPPSNRERIIFMNDTKAAIDVIVAVAEAIRALGEVPSGHLYARVMGQMDLRTYTKVIDLLKGAGVVSESGYLLTWTGPNPGA